MSQIQRSIRTLLKLLLRRPIVGACIIPVLPDGRIVLIQRRDSQKWGLPGGIVDWGEDIAATVGREMTEETGMTVERVERLVGVYSHVRRDPRFHSVCILVEARVTGDFAIQDQEEVMAVQAFAREEIPRGSLAHDHDRQLQDYFNGATVLA